MKHILYILLVALSFSSCKNENVLLDEFKDIQNETWDWDEKKEFSIILKEPDFSYDVSVNLRVSTDYEYENMYVIMHITNPKGKTNKETVQLKLAEADGKWLGTTSGGIVNFRMPIQNRFPMATPGKWKFAIEQHMREKQLSEVNSIGLHIVKRAKIF